jgi:FkbM family methyltransferase
MLRWLRLIRNLLFSNEATITQLTTPSYYPVEKTCQITNLNSIYEIFFGLREQGIFVEIGANDGVSCSNTWGLAVRGWRGYLVEPVPSFAKKCRFNHREHNLVSTHEIAIGLVDGVDTVLNIAGMLTTANEVLVDEYKTVSWSKGLLTSEKIQVKSLTLDTFLRENEIKANFDLLVVDVEGYESQVFSGFSLEKWLPKMLIVELADTHPDLKSTRISDARLGLDLLSKGYLVVYKDWINTVFVREDVWEDSLK